MNRQQCITRIQPFVSIDTIHVPHVSYSNCSHLLINDVLYTFAIAPHEDGDSDHSKISVFGLPLNHFGNKTESAFSVKVNAPFGDHLTDFMGISVMMIRNEIYLYMIIDEKGYLLKCKFSHNYNEMEIEIVNYQKVFYDNCPIIPDSKRNCFYFLCGACQYEYSRKVVKCDLNTYEWSEIGREFELEDVLTDHSAVLWKDRYIVTFAGCVSHRRASTSMFAFDLDELVWKAVYTPKASDRQYSEMHYDRFGVAASLVSNRYGSSFNKACPNTDENDTLFMYGGLITMFLRDDSDNVRKYQRKAHDVYLQHLDDSKWPTSNLFSLTDFVNPSPIKLRLHDFTQDDPNLDSNVFVQSDNKDYIEDFKILKPLMTFSTIIHIKNVEEEKLCVIERVTDRVTFIVLRRTPLLKIPKDKLVDLRIICVE